MDIIVPKLGIVKGTLLETFEMNKVDNFGEFLPLVNFNKYGNFSYPEYHPYCYSQGKPLNAVSLRNNPVIKFQKYVYNPFTAFDPVLNPEPTYMKSSGIRGLMTLNAIAPGSSNDVNYTILQSLLNGGLPMGDSSNVETTNPRIDNKFPFQLTIKTDGMLFPEIKTWDYKLVGTDTTVKQKEYFAKLVRFEAIGDYPPSKYVKLDGEEIDMLPEASWNTAEFVYTDPDNPTVKYMPFTFNVLNGADALTGKVTASYVGQVKAKVTTIYEDGRPPITELREGGTVTMIFEMDLYYEVAEPVFETRELNEDKTLKRVLYNFNGDEDLTNMDSTNFTVFNYSDGIKFNFISKMDGNAFGYDPLHGDLKLPNILSSQLYDTDGLPIFKQHYWFDDELTTDTTKFIIRQGLWLDTENLDIYLSKTNQDNYPTCFGATIYTDLKLPTKLIPLAFNEDDTYIIELDEPKTYSRLFTINSGIYTAVCHAEEKTIYFVLVNGGGYLKFDMSELIDYDIDYFGFDAELLIVYVGNKSLESEPTNKYSIINLEFTPPEPERKRKKIVLDYDKINFNFIACQTHCLAKGGIISKV